MASGHHAEIDRDLNGYTIRDLGSTNGTILNGDPITEALLTHGSRLRIGNARFAFKDPSMKDVEVELAHFDEDEGWGMMGELDLSRARGSKMGILLVVLLFAAAGAGAWFLAQDKGQEGPNGVRGVALVANGDFDADDVPWTASREEGTTVARKTTGGKPGAYLAASNRGEGLGSLLVAYDESIETAGTQPLRFLASVRGKGDGPARYVVIWESDPTPEELRAGVLDLERTDVLLEPTGGWKQVDETRVPPSWAKSARVALLLGEGASGDVDSVEIERISTPGERPSIPVRQFKNATLDATACLDLMANRTVLLTGVHPVARTKDGALLSRFTASGPIQVDGDAVLLEGAFSGPEGEELPARIAWKATEEGLRFEMACAEAASIGLQAAAPARHVGGTVNVLGAFLPQSFPVYPGDSLERVSRTLLGEPGGEGGGPSSLVAIVQDENRDVATLEFVPARDPGLVAFRHWLPGSEGSMEVTTDFTRAKERAEKELESAIAESRRAPGQAIVKLREIAQANPFEPRIRDRASQVASELETTARQEIGDLRVALRDFRIYRSADALLELQTLTAKLAKLYPIGDGPAGSLETDVAELVHDVGEARREYEIALAGPGVDRLERLTGLLESVKGYRPMAALYARAMVGRYSHLEAQAEDIARRLTAARATLEKLQADEAVADALPPLPPK